jgi:hypothetical protein
MHPIILNIKNIKNTVERTIINMDLFILNDSIINKSYNILNKVKQKNL